MISYDKSLISSKNIVFDIINIYNFLKFDFVYKVLIKLFHTHISFLIYFFDFRLNNKKNVRAKHKKNNTIIKIIKIHLKFKISIIWFV